MIPIIGIMIAAYIITRMLNLIIDKAKETNAITMVFAVLTILVSLYAAYVLFTKGTELAGTLFNR